ncbi:hypothetical protein HUT18_14955 [Streptomyces sp. NA04227]|uniref:acyl carrier protein n=1 Tax=Streptomyces sp. NA04227 TaxID=2742136 RepID=UPI000A2067CF|nr:phosphopantetheine-binding protein [Streptomyces sp. NA04227]ARM20263.1 SauB [Streptomyces sp.]QKW07489.1 hypothetical protein HUT18_14955 [Streptomyces sp. NA04227]
MDESEITYGVREVIAQVLSLSVDEVSPTAHFYDELAGDSLQKLEAIAFIEAKFNVQLTNEEAAGETVGDLVRSVVGHAS